MPKVTVTANEASLIAHAIIDAVANLEGWAGGTHSVAFIDKRDQYMARPLFVRQVRRILNAVLENPEESRMRVSRLVSNLRYSYEEEKDAE